MSHPFKGDPQYEQVHGNRHGPPMGRPGNGLGDVPAWFTPVGADDPVQIFRSNDRARVEWEDEDEPLIELDDSLVDELYEALQQLTARQAFVVSLRFGLRDGATYTQQEVADLMGVSQVTVLRHEEAGLKRLRTLLNLDTGEV